MSQSDTVPVYSTPFPSFRRSSSMLRGFMCPSLRCQMSAAGIHVSQSLVLDVGVSCGGVHDPKYIVVGDSFGFAEQLILRVALEHDVERAHSLVSRVLFE